jgi:DNA modification methylase/transcriptional regulator with XRE-family HTH domain
VSHTTSEIPTTIASIRSQAGLSQGTLAKFLGVSFVSVNRWERGVSSPSPAQAEKILQLKGHLDATGRLPGQLESNVGVFASHGIRQKGRALPLFTEPPQLELQPETGAPILSRVRNAHVFHPLGKEAIEDLLRRNQRPAETASTPHFGTVSAGKNSYTYDAHTYHTKVPPQGIAELVQFYLPQGGLVLDPFGGSGMTGVACAATGHDCILNELSPAACFISSRFVARVSSERFADAVRVILRETENIRRALYTTTCRECGRLTEILYTVWSYRVTCDSCSSEFQLWDVCRSYGPRVREHKILKEFDCPSCGKRLAKSRLARTVAEPVQLGYSCCGSRQQETVHTLSDADRELIRTLDKQPLAEPGFFPSTPLPHGVNLSQPRRHGLSSIDRFYTQRNLAAMSHLWKVIHRVEDVELAAHLAFVFTSLYQRVTRLSEFRFWGGSGNTARFNVPFVFNEANVFVTFERKARTIQDHLATTATHYQGSPVVMNGSATNIHALPNESVDFIFTDPPFGANINYSEMNLLWESWLGDFTDASDEAVVNRVQGKDVDAYGRLMLRSLEECYRVLRPDHWLVLMFMNTSASVWKALRSAILEAGFEIRHVECFDKQHATFKQFVSENAAGEDLVIHCYKPEHRSQGTSAAPASDDASSPFESVHSFLRSIDVAQRVRVYLHVGREQEVDVKQLYSEWMARAVRNGVASLNFADFRSLVEEHLKSTSEPPRKRSTKRREDSSDAD